MCRHSCVRPFYLPAPVTLDCSSVQIISGSCCLPGFLPDWCSRLWRRPHRIAAPPDSGCLVRLDRRDHLPRRIRRCSGSPRTALYLAAYLGALLKPQPHGLAGAALGLIAIFLPGLLLVVCILPFWSKLRANPSIRFALAGINASVVGILAAALYRPVLTSSVRTLSD